MTLSVLIAKEGHLGELDLFSDVSNHASCYSMIKLLNAETINRTEGVQEGLPFCSAHCFQTKFDLGLDPDACFKEI